MATRPVNRLGCLLLLLAVVVLPVNLTLTRGRRSDDPAPLEAIVNELSQQMTQMSAQIQAQAAQIQAQSTQIQNLKAQIATDEEAVAFTAKFSQDDVLHLGSGQTLKFDNVLYNAGSGYNPTTGVFTAPSSGTYFFTVQVMRHNNDDTITEVAIYKGNADIAHAHACCSTSDTSSASATTHLNQGETVHVRIVQGTMLYGQRITAFSGMKISPK